MKSSLPLLLLAALLCACESTTMPTPEQMDALAAKVRAERNDDYAALEQARATGRVNALEYQTERAALDKSVQDKVDTMLWSRHALAQSERKANKLPTPDQPIDNPAPGAGNIQGSLYSSSRLNGLGNQQQANFMRDVGGAQFNGRRAGSVWDQPQ